MTTEVTIVIPTYNEHENIGPLVKTIDNVMKGIDWEMIFVDDDSPDGTAEVIAKFTRSDKRVRLITRIGRRGLSSACIEGMLASSSPYLAVMDADFQHDENLLPHMLERLKQGEADLVVASRCMDGASFGALDRTRVRISQFARLLSRLVVRIELSDPMSGYFALRRTLLERTVRRLYGKGFKILLDLVASADPPPRVLELPYTMRERQRGASKLDTVVTLEYLVLLLDKLFRRLVPVKFLLFAAVGTVGVFVHLAVLAILFLLSGREFLLAQAIATGVAMTSNFVLNNVFTHRDNRLRGRGFFRGLLTFYAACSIGAILNISFANLLYGQTVAWWLAGLLGAIVGAIWNYALTSAFTWGRTSITS